MLQQWIFDTVQGTHSSYKECTLDGSVKNALFEMLLVQYRTVLLVVSGRVQKKG